MSGTRKRLGVPELCLIALVGLGTVLIAHWQISLWAGSKGVVVAHSGEQWLELVRLLGLGVTGTALGAIVGDFTRHRLALAVFGAALFMVLGLPALLLASQFAGFSTNL